MRTQYLIALFFLLLAPLLVPNSALSSEGKLKDKSSNANNKHMRITRINEASRAPKIDGLLDEKLWSELKAIEDFHQVRPQQFAPPSERTRLWIAYDQDMLYIAARMFEQHPDAISLRETIQGKDFDSDDLISITLDPFNNKREGYLFQVNPFGLRSEALITNSDSELNDDWRAIWFAAANIDDKSWTVEVAIPFKSLSFNPHSDTWGINFGRVIRRKGETIAWSSQGDNVWENAPSLTGELQPINNINQGLGLDVKISGVVNRLEDHLNKQNTNDAEPSVDIFYKPSPAFTVVGTLNTDFSATEIDDLKVNTGRFSLKLAEKRDFFLQDANQYTFADLSANGRPFYSRSIGLDSNGQPIPLNGGLKLSGRLHNYNVGLLAIQQEASTEQKNDADLFVFRGSRNIFAESNLGFIYTNGDPQSDQKNEVLGFDFNYNNSQAFDNKLVQASLWYQESHDEISNSDNSAYGFTLAYPNSRYSLDWTFQTIEQNFNPAMGFVNRTDIRRNDFNGAFRHYFLNRWVLYYEPKFDYEIVDNTLGERQSEYLHIAPIQFESVEGDLLRIGWDRMSDTVHRSYEPVPGFVVNPGDYDNNVYWYMVLNSSTSRAFYLKTSIWRESYFGAARFNQRYTLGWRPFRSWLLTSKHETKEFDFKGGEFTLRISSLKSELALSRDWAWFLIAQFDNKSNYLGLQSRLRWLPQADRELYFVINKGMIREEEEDFFRAIRDEYVVKASYTFRF
ncbi:Carbohydrate family 9 binding domain-like [Alteromonadaceae bacterium Bs31]|nr:Carbohydrate family 9 binding domain-like [Alteromonadaceae bacterium Bs31]